MPKYMVQRERREMPADFETVYVNGMRRVTDLMKKYRAGNATVERWIDAVELKLAEGKKNGAE